MKAKALILVLSFLLMNFVILTNTSVYAAAEDDDDDDDDATKNFAGIDFGIGLSLTMDTGDHNRIESAEIVNGRVRVTKENNDIPRIMLETHWLFLPQVHFLGIDSVKPNEWGWGPFVCIQNGSNEIVEAIGAGIMLGFRRNVDTIDSFNIGIGMVVDPSVKILGDGIEEDQPLPEGETEIRYKETSQWGVLIMTSYSF